LVVDIGVTARPEFPRFLARPPWLGGDLQTVRNHLLRRFNNHALVPDECVEFPAGDGSGDVLIGGLNRPPAPAAGERRPLVVLVHGLTGCQDSMYMQASARNLLAEGHPVLRLNMRGAGPSRATCRFEYHAGRSEDLRAVIGRMDGRLAANGLVMVGYSLGANILLKYLGEQGRLAPLLGAVSVSAPIDLVATQRRFMQPRNRRYHDHILARMKDEVMSPHSALDAQGRASLADIATVYDFDDRIVAPRNGFAGADEYYARCSSEGLLREVRVPTLLIHAQNDPWIPADAYRRFDWSVNPRLVPLLPRGGGHVGFHGLGSRIPWHDRCIAQFIRTLRR
jgi:predicted alpha/beta-fold hydrolase